MPDYASILRRSVSALPDPSPEMREAVYQRARAALARQLTAVDPPLSTREIETQHQELEDAVVRLEAEFAPQDEPAAGFRRVRQRKDEFLYSAPQTATARRRRRRRPSRPTISARGAGRTTPIEDEDDDFEDDEERSSRVPLLIGLVLRPAGGRRRRRLPLSRNAGRSSASSASAPRATVAAVEAAGRRRRQRNATDAGRSARPSDQRRRGQLAGAHRRQPRHRRSIRRAGASAAAGAKTPPTPRRSNPDSEQTAAPREPAGTNLVEQRAIYYYQGAEGTAGQASEGTATWAEITKDDRPAIQATLRIAEPQRHGDRHHLQELRRRRCRRAIWSRCSSPASSRRAHPARSGAGAEADRAGARPAAGGRRRAGHQRAFLDRAVRRRGRGRRATSSSCAKAPGSTSRSSSATRRAP